jgi:tRNA/rRNA methyltransferase
VPRFRVVLIEPLNDGNIGAVARAMANFALRNLYLVRPCAVGEEAVKRAMHGADVLKNARTVFAEDEALKGVRYVAATSGVDTENEKHFNRISMPPWEFAQKVREVEGEVALLFGREDFGLDKELLRRCDFLVTIPANKDYSILNVSHAAVILFYELHAAGFERWEPRRAEEMETEKLHEYFSALLDTIDYPEHKKEKTKVMFRRIVGRAVPSVWEYHTLMGVLDGAIKSSSQTGTPAKDGKRKGSRPSELR